MMGVVGQVVAGLLLAAAIIGALGVIVRAVIYLAGVIHKLNRLIDDLAGEPPRPGFPEGRPGVLDRLASIEGSQSAGVDRLAAMEKRLTAVEVQLRPNGGSTLRDAVDRIEQSQPNP